MAAMWKPGIIPRHNPRSRIHGAEPVSRCSHVPDRTRDTAIGNHHRRNIIRLLLKFLVQNCLLSAPASMYLMDDE